MNCGGRSQVRAEIGGRVGASGIALCSRIAVFFEKVLDGENRVRDIRIDDGQPAFVMPVLIRAPHSKSSGSLIRSYGRGKGLSIAAPCNNMPGQLPVSPSLHRVTPQDHLGVNRGSFKAPHAPSDVLGGGRRG